MHPVHSTLDNAWAASGNSKLSVTLPETLPPDIYSREMKAMCKQKPVPGCSSRFHSESAQMRNNLNDPTPEQ